MNKYVSAVLAGAIFLQGALPLSGVGLSPAELGGAELIVGVLVAGLSSYLKGTPAVTPSATITYSSSGYPTPPKG